MMATDTRLSTLALICDCDGVLVDSEVIAARVLIQELGVRWPDADVAPVVMPLLGHRTERVLAETASTLGRVLSPTEIDAIHRVVQSEAVKAPAVEGIEAALANVPIAKACASNSFSDYVTQVLERTGLGKFFLTNVFTADMVPNPKPAPDVYLLAASELGVDPGCCLVVEDSFAGATAATSAGMTVLGYVGSAHSPEEQATRLREAGARHTFHHMEQLPGLAERWIKEIAITRPASAAQ
jgi:HAD superfamily hydrolase (TIGR01509 family)